LIENDDAASVFSIRTYREDEQVLFESQLVDVV
jgi:hypothetical protein